MQTCQATILAPVEQAACFLTLGLSPGADPRPALERLADMPFRDGLVVGLGEPLTARMNTSIEGLSSFPALSSKATAFPSTQGALWLSLSGEDSGSLLRRALSLVALLGPAFRIDEDVLGFKHAGGRDLTGYEDGTENPKGDKAQQVAIVANRGPGFDGGSFVAVQRWVHDLGVFERMSQEQRDFVIGRHHESNEELADAPESAHVKRAAQESYEPEAFMLRKSIPWGNVTKHGLYFVAYGASLSPFERVLTRMSGREDGTADALLSFTHAVTGGYYFCPPLHQGKLDLRCVGLR